MTKTVTYEWLGRQPYRPVWEYQKSLLQDRVDGNTGDRLLFVEHHPTYTLGKAGDENHLLADERELESRHAEYVPIDRGGDITYHGPGQLVGYPILHLENYKKDVHWYLRQLEETIIRTLAEFDISGTRDEEYTGVWVSDEKVAAIGVKVSRWVTMHGFALNVSTDLSYFGRIIPCGIFHKGVCSLESLLGEAPSLETVQKIYLSKFAHVFECEVREAESNLPTESVTDEKTEVML
ncbi:MAG: lipoyl(octanoyl) transferase LipB [Candidatus Marinimicrobia bacterium]|nr:lipoyl(octanoyl) transferase LipB [Candidatus Neomarinimicrobiota bacterium]MCF7828406.1 lipoyl(octanoyl) transferase LipB [Candidatus Neomarinimicrobiota bacterium]MCF7881000.1 lipoyl(octanoyl) transferase LipB [Candidatus Neomarinimicrobiota bacterium]